MSDRDEVAEVLWRASDDNDDPDLTWENNYVRDEWYRMADALLASDWLARREAEARAEGAASATWVALQLRAALAARSDQEAKP